MSKLSFFLILVFSIIMIIGYFIDQANAVELVWVGGDKGVRQVPVYYVDRVFCNDTWIDNKGCYNGNTDEIKIKIGYESMWVPRGCTVLQHEIGHAWGLSEAQVGIFNCANPDIDPNAMQYDPTNFEHSDPLYEHVPYDSSCPRCEK